MFLNYELSPNGLRITLKSLEKHVRVRFLNLFDCEAVDRFIEN